MNLRAVQGRIDEAAKPPPDLTLSQWADENRWISPEGAPEPGRWNTSRAEYQRELMDVIGDISVSTVVCMKSSQIGWTEILNNAAAYYICADPCPILMVQPNIEMAATWSKDRFAPMIRDTPVLRDKIPPSRTRDSGNTIRSKQFPGGQIAIIGANAPAGLASRPIRVVLADEVDRYPASAGTEGNPLSLAAKRQQNFWNAKTLIGSTPTVKNMSEIESQFENSDQRRFFVPCKDCRETQYLKWQNVKWDKANGEHLPETAHYVCEHCGSLWDDLDRHDAVAEGKWVATKPFNGVAGFHISGMMSPWLTLEKIVRDFLVARKDFQKLKTFVNTVLGETWEDSGETVDPNSLPERCDTYTPNSLPDDIRLITAGIDTQRNRLEMYVIGWGVGERSWSIKYDVIHGDPTQVDVWNELDHLLLSEFHTESGRVMHIRAACVDTGGHHAHQAQSFCTSRMRRRIWPIKGAAGVRPIWPKNASRSKHNMQIYTIGVDTAKETIHTRLKITDPSKSGYMNFPAKGGDFTQEFFNQLTSEQAMTRFKDGKAYRVWVLPSGRRNEALDCAVYALAARHSIMVQMERLRVSEPTIDRSPPMQPVAFQGPVYAPAGSSVVKPKKRSIASMIAR